METLVSRPAPPAPPPPAPWTWRDRLRGARMPALVLAGGVAACTYVAVADPNGAGSLYPACPLKATTGIDCPGCGMTRAAFALLHGDVARAADHNLLFVIALPFLLWAIVRWAAASMGWALPSIPRPKPAWFATTMAVLFLAFAVARNLPVAPLSWLGSAAT